MGREAEYRRHAVECFEMAGTTTHESLRTTLLVIAKQWLLLANQTSGNRFSSVMDDFNNNQMREQ